MEFVYVVPREKLFPDCYPQGLVPFGDAASLTRFQERVDEHGFFVERAHAERTPALKQIIPYSVVVRGGNVLLLRRTARGGESRLHDKLSIGIGGHVNPEDADPALAGGTSGGPVEVGSLREIHEELVIEGPFTTTRVGLLNDDSNAVGAVHVGLVQVLSCEGSVEVREKDVLQGRFAPPTELRDLLRDGADFETWSIELLERLDELLPRNVAGDSRFTLSTRATVGSNP